MLSFLTNFRKLLTSKNYDAEILGNVYFSKQNIPYFTVKMHGCNTPIDISAEQIIERFTEKFSQVDILNAAKVYMKYKNFHKLVSIEKNFAIIHNVIKESYELVDLNNHKSIKSLDFDCLKTEDAFTLGVHFERIRQERDLSLFKFTKNGHNVTKFEIVK